MAAGELGRRLAGQRRQRGAEGGALLLGGAALHVSRELFLVGGAGPAAWRSARDDVWVAGLVSRGCGRQAALRRKRRRATRGQLAPGGWSPHRRTPRQGGSCCWVQAADARRTTQWAHQYCRSAAAALLGPDAPASHMNLALSELQSLSEAKAASTHTACLAAHACWQLCPPGEDTSWMAGGSGGAGGTGTCGRPSCAREDGRAGGGVHGLQFIFNGSQGRKCTLHPSNTASHSRRQPKQGRSSGRTFEKQCLRAAMNAFSCCVERAVVRHAARQYWNGVSHLPVSGLQHRNTGVGG